MKIPGADLIRSAIFEDDPKSDNTPIVKQFSPSTPSLDPGPIQSATVDNRVYQRLRELTDFTCTKAGMAVNKYMPSLLETVGESKAFSAALKIAHANDGLTDEDIAAAFAQMKSRLDAFQKEGESQLANFKGTQLDARAERISQNEEKINKLRAENAEMANGLKAFQVQYEEKRASLTAAIARRATEIQREEQERVNLLKH